MRFVERGKNYSTNKARFFMRIRLLRIPRLKRVKNDEYPKRVRMDPAFIPQLFLLIIYIS